MFNYCCCFFFFFFVFLFAFSHFIFASFLCHKHGADALEWPKNQNRKHDSFVAMATRDVFIIISFPGKLQFAWLLMSKLMIMSRIVNIGFVVTSPFVDIWKLVGMGKKGLYRHSLHG